MWESSSESDSEDASEENDDDLLLLEDEEEELKFSSVSETELELDSDGSEYCPTGRNAKRQEALKSKLKALVIALIQTWETLFACQKWKVH